MAYIESFLAECEAWIWSAPLLALLLGGGLYLTFLLRGIQFRYLGSAFKQIFAPIRKGAEGDISPFEALTTSLAGAIGTGAIVGVATAVTIGGMGALFWMWVMAFLGMATKYAESILAVKYRDYGSRGEVNGGPMQYMEKGLGWTKTATFFAVFGMIASFGIGNLVQVNAIAEVAGSTFSLNPWITGILVAIAAGAVVIGGVKSIGHATGILVPLMGILYVGGGLFVILAHLDHIPEAFALIFSSAFKGQAAAGGFTGTTVMMAIQTGVSRSVFSNEAGLGVPSIASAAAKTDSPGRQAMITMVGPFFSTIIVCTITGLVLAVTKTASSGGAVNVIAAFNTSIVGGTYVVSAALALFAFFDSNCLGVFRGKML